MFASQMGHSEVVKLLLGKGAQLEFLDEEGWNALMYAARYGHAETAGLLIDSGARTQVVDKVCPYCPFLLLLLLL